MGQLDAFLNGKQGLNGISLKGKTPDTRAGALATSEIHAQGATDTKLKADHSILDLDGKTPDKYEKPADISGQF